MSDFKKKKIDEIQKSLKCLIQRNLLDIYKKMDGYEPSQLEIDSAKEYAEHLAWQANLALTWTTRDFTRFDWDRFFDRVRDVDYLTDDEDSE